VNPVAVYLYEGQDFSVDPNANAQAENGSQLSIGTHPRPFTVTGCKKWFFLFRVAQLTMDQGAIPDWQSTFTAGTAIVIPMLLANNTTESLSFDLLATEQSTVPALLVFKRAVHAVAYAVLLLAVSVFTLRIFRRSKATDEIAEAVHTEGH